MKKEKSEIKNINPEKTISFESKWIDMKHWDVFMKTQKSKSIIQSSNGILKIIIY